MCVTGKFITKPERSPSPTASPTLYQERAVFGKMKMDPAKRAQTQNAGEVSSLQWFFWCRYKVPNIKVPNHKIPNNKVPNNEIPK